MGLIPNIEIVIDELFLHGFERRDRHRIGYAIQDELTSLVSGSDHFSLLKQRQETVDGGIVLMDQGAQASDVGSQIAQAVYRGISE